MKQKFSIWRKSARSSGGDNCVEVSFADNGDVGVRDSKNRTGGILDFTPAEWAAFIGGVRDGDFDH